MTAELSITQMRLLKIAAQHVLADPFLFTEHEQMLLTSAVTKLNVAIRQGNRVVEKADRLRFLRENTLAEERDVTADTLLKNLAPVWIEEIVAEGRVKRQTIDRYTETLRTAVVPVLGELPLSEITVGMLDRFLKGVASQQTGLARHCKVVLNQMFGLAVRHGALTSNPVRDVGRIYKAKKEVVVVGLGEIDRIRAAILRWQDSHTSGPRKKRDLADIVDLMLATGGRIGEILALRWSDIDLDRRNLTISGTLIFIKGEGWHRQDWPKSKAGHRTVFLPKFATDMLYERRPSIAETSHGAVFASRTGTYLQPDNVRRQWRQVRLEAGLEWVTPHVFRKTVATLLNEEGLPKEATAQLGHSTEEVTKMYYIAKPAMAPDVSDVLQRLGPARLL